MKAEKNFKSAAGEATGSGLFAKNLRLAIETIGELEPKHGYGLKIWGDWLKEPDFPVVESLAPAWHEYTPYGRYLFIDTYLTSILGERPHPTRPGHVRPDMNGVNGSKRAWLMNKVLLRIVEEAQPRHLRSEKNYRYPEDLPKVAYDMYLLHKHHSELPAGPPRTLQYYKTAEALRDAVKPWRPKYPISHERLAAHHRFLKVADPVTGDPIYNGNGEAELVAKLKDGTEVIQVKSEAASLAYGSPRWCTAYREKETVFWNYADDLLIIINPEGERWQMHFRTEQFVDADDERIPDIPGFLQQYEGLTEALTPAFLRQFDGDKLYNGTAALLTLAANVPSWREIMTGGVLEKIFRRSAELGALQFLGSALLIAQGEPAWRKRVPLDVFTTAISKADQQLEKIGYTLEAAHEVPEWRREMAALLSYAVVRVMEARQYDTVDLIFNVASKTPAWRGSLKNVMGVALMLASQQDSSRAVDIVLNAAAKSSQWRKAVSGALGDALTELHGHQGWSGINSILRFVRTNPSRQRHGIVAEAISQIYDITNGPYEGDTSFLPLLLADIKDVQPWQKAFPEEIIPAELLKAALDNKYGAVNLMLAGIENPPESWQRSVQGLLGNPDAPEALKAKVEEFLAGQVTSNRRTTVAGNSPPAAPDFN